MDQPPVSSAEKHEHFSLPLFAFTVVVTLGGLFALVWLIVPQVWFEQLSAPFWKGAVVFGVVTLINCFVEYFFHRYVLHTPAIPFLRRLYRQHTHHHALTRIVRKSGGGGREIFFIENKFPIIEPEQGEASFFPWYSLAVFALLLTPLLTLLQWQLPSFPWFFVGFLALASSLAMYEIVHAIDHWPFQRWSPLIDHPRWGRFWRGIYGFHLRHHAVIHCNESISGFFGLPIADWAFGTCVIPKTIFADGERATDAKFASPKPRAVIRLLDSWAAKAVHRHRARAAQDAQKG
jgi:hemolysin III